MKKIAVFGKPGSGKSTLSKRLARVIGIELHQLDLLQYNKSGEQVAREIFDNAHQHILEKDCWIIDGLGPMGTFKQRLDAADTLVYIDLSYPLSYWLVTKRCIKGLFVKPEGWPEGSSVLKGTIQSYKTLKLCPKFWNSDFLNQLEADYSATKQLYVIRTLSQLNHFVENNVSKPQDESSKS
ncbi:AAA family ATPase [Pseudoalteromonas sp. JBTF-M23]|uniref:AAA family ATPase n=1 Tax=Pseudoalteromonas caenipelagi TaxID=2726988 RepID=A0A849VAC1_9GAMM|nr:AAA family ATPase [Pseudoalteromonas caenipelagi]NOU49720.1 AAA family ATPase [Pseudoalteromonas caenipelagi]